MILQSGENLSNTTSKLSARRLSKAFGPVTVLNDVDVDFFAGEIHAVVGENGAGKSTLFRKTFSGCRVHEAEHKAQPCQWKLLTLGHSMNFQFRRERNSKDFAQQQPSTNAGRPAALSPTV